MPGHSRSPGRGCSGLHLSKSLCRLPQTLQVTWPKLHRAVRARWDSLGGHWMAPAVSSRRQPRSPPQVGWLLGHSAFKQGNLVQVHHGHVPNDVRQALVQQWEDDDVQGGPLGLEAEPETVVRDGGQGQRSETAVRDGGQGVKARDGGQGRQGQGRWAGASRPGTPGRGFKARDGGQGWVPRLSHGAQSPCQAYRHG